MSPTESAPTSPNATRAFNDDWFAFSLDSAGTGQTAYHLFTNPSGSQMDALNTSASGEQFDADMVWFSAAKTTADGYIVEMRVPLQTLRFSGGESVQMGLVFFRKVSRIGVSYSWPEMLPGQWVFDRPAHLTFSNLKPRRLVEVLPSVTYNISQERASSDRWAATDDKTNVGASGKFGITSGITLDGTINPDFSQVESDAFQVQVNQRFPVFFSEKRPFFMEGMGLFNIAGTGGDGNMRTAVHTRRIIDPIFGSKITGTIGKTTFGVLNAADDKPDIADPTPELAERNKIYTISRATYALRRSDYFGGIFTHTYHDGRDNLVAGGDLSLRVSPAQNFSTTFLASHTSERTGSTTAGNAVQASYGYETRRINFGSQIEHYGRDFQMDTAFYNRTGFTAGWSFGEINFYPEVGHRFLDPAHSSVLLHENRARRHPGRRRGLRQLRHPVQPDAAGFPEHLPEPRLRTVAGHEVRRRSGHQLLRNDAGVRLAGVQWRERDRPGDLLRSGRSLPGPVVVRRYRRHVPAEPAPHAEPRRQLGPLRSRRHRRARLQRGHSQLADDLSVRQAFPDSIPRSVRQLRAADLDGPAGVVRARARHRVSRGVRVAVRETRR